MYAGRICPLMNKANQVPMGELWQCHEAQCRFQIDGVCAILGNYHINKNVDSILFKMAQAFNVKL